VSEFGIFSPFFLKRVWAKKNSSPISVLFCDNCGSKFFDVVLSKKDLSKLYKNYRGEIYFKERNYYEPWYTKKFNSEISDKNHYDMRRDTLAHALVVAKVKNTFQNVLDHGGDRGQMLKAGKGYINAKYKYVYEISGIQPIKGVVACSQDQMKNKKWDLILSCHVLEHLSNPKTYLDMLVSLGSKKTIYYIEVPNEHWKSLRFNKSSIQFAWLDWLSNKLLLIKFLQFLSLAMKIKLNFIPPFLFSALNEHVNFFTVKGLTNIIKNSNLILHTCFIAESGHIVAVAEKK